MIENLVMLETYGTGIRDFLVKLESLGFFAYVLPFLLIFALVYGILSITKLFQENKAINGIIAFVIGLLSLQFDLVPKFFSEIFPRLGVGLAVILVVIILLGIFYPKQNWVSYTMFGIAGLVLLIVLYKTAGALNWYSGTWWVDNWVTIAAVVFILVALGIIVGASQPSKGDVETPFIRSLFAASAPAAAGKKE